MLEKQNDAKPEEKPKAMNKFKAFSVADIRKMVKKADKTAKKDADNNV